MVQVTSNNYATKEHICFLTAAFVLKWWKFEVLNSKLEALYSWNENTHKKIKSAQWHFWWILTLQIFDGNILTDDHCLSPYTCIRCIVFKPFDGLNFDGLAWKHQKCQNCPCQNFALYGRLQILCKCRLI